MLDAFDFEPVMFTNVPLAVYDYTAHGDGSEFTLRRNREAFEWVDLVPRTPVEPSRIDLSCEILGTRMKYPIRVAPTATQVPLHPEGEMGMHRAATDASNTPTIVSQNASMTVGRIASAASGPLWWQFYTAEDAALCVEHGVDGIVVSNHGGRSTDYGPSTLEVLPEIVAAVKGRIPVLTDSGCRRGADILKALALGADAVLLGRATRWAPGASARRAFSGRSRSFNASWPRQPPRPGVLPGHRSTHVSSARVSFSSDDHRRNPVFRLTWK